MTSTTYSIYIDEAGRGPIAGPVVVGLVLGSKGHDRQGYHDSKSLNKKQREQLYHKIQSDSSLIRASGSASAKEIDRYGIIWALRRATIRGLYAIIRQILQNKGYSIHKGNQCYRKKLIEVLGSLGNFQLIIDGNHDFGLTKDLGIPVQTIIKGDRDVAQISAASIIAKVTRDREMIRLGHKYSEYGFESHVGYGTRKHYEAITQYGLCEIHRTKWIRTQITN